MSAQDFELDFSSTVENTVKILSAHESAIAHSAVRAEILRAVIEFDQEGPASTASTTSMPSIDPHQRRSLVESVVNSQEDELISAEFYTALAIILTIPAANDAGEGSGSSSIWGKTLLNAHYLDAVQDFGKACGDPGNFQSSLLGLLTVRSFTEGIRRNIVAGGCNCSRANFLGAVLGAAYGLDEPNGIPLDWLAQTDRGLETLELALKLFAK